MAAAGGVGTVEAEDLLGRAMERHRTEVAWERQEGRYVTSNMHGGRIFVRWVVFLARVACQQSVRMGGGARRRQRVDLDWSHKHAAQKQNTTLSSTMRLDPHAPPHRSWIPTDRPKPLAVVFLAHGVNEHIGRYTELAHALTKEGYAGESESSRAVESIDRSILVYDRSDPTALDTT